MFDEVLGEQGETNGTQILNREKHVNTGRLPATRTAKHFAFDRGCSYTVAFIAKVLIASVPLVHSQHAFCSDSIPVEEPTQISIHQFRYDKFSSEYKLSVLRSGAVTYEGVSNVREIGVRQFEVPPAKVADAIRQLTELHENGLMPVKGRVGHSESSTKLLLISVRSGLEKWTVSLTIGNAPFKKYAELHDVVEKFFPTERFRCPYYAGSEDPTVPPRIRGQAVEVCSAMKTRNEKSKIGG